LLPGETPGGVATPVHSYGRLYHSSLLVFF